MKASEQMAECVEAVLKYGFNCASWTNCQGVFDKIMFRAARSDDKDYVQAMLRAERRKDNWNVGLTFRKDINDEQIKELMRSMLEELLNAFLIDMELE